MIGSDATLPRPVRATPLLEARGMRKAFLGVQALNGAGITVRTGRLTALLGENGAGKSTLINILAGVFPPDAGMLLLDGHPVSFRSPREAREARLSTIFQELHLVGGLSIAENIFLGSPPLTCWGLIDRARMNHDAGRILAALDLDLDPVTPVERLKVGGRQMVEIAKALSFDARVLILDEPTSALTGREVESLFETIRMLKARGVGMVYITHRLDELPAIADDVTIFRDGALVHEAEFCVGDRDDYVRRMVGRELTLGKVRTEARLGPTVLDVNQLSLTRRDGGLSLLDDITLSVRGGEVVGLFGLLGAGRTELLEAIYGLHGRSCTGEVRMFGSSLAIGSPTEALAAGIALAPEDRKADGLVLGQSVAWNMSLASLGSVLRHGLVSGPTERARAAAAIADLSIKTTSPDQPVSMLSGGNQQKVVLAKALATRPRLLLLDEPTRGIDVGAKRQIYGLIDAWARQGMAILVASSELPELLAISDRILVLAEGRLTGSFSCEEATVEALLRAAIPASRTSEVLG